MNDSIVWRILALLTALFSAVVLPYALPLGGFDTVHPTRLADANGAFVRLDNERLYYTHTPGPGEDVILIHGFGGSTVTWQDTGPALAAAGYDVYALDLLGFGLSDKGWNHNYSHAAQAARIVHFMDQMGIERAHVVGHSMGGNVAAYLALAYPERVDKLVLVAPAIVDGAGDDRMRFAAKLLDVPFVRRWGQIVLRRVLSPRFEDILLSAASGSAAADDWMKPDLYEGYRRALTTPEWDLGLLALTRDAGQNQLPAPLSEMRAPTFIVWGTEDNWVSPDNAARLERLIPNSTRIEFEGVGHVLMHETPGQFNEALIAFLHDAV